MNAKDIRKARPEIVVLLADDDAFIRTLLRKALEDSATVIEVADGTQVMDAYKKHLPDCVFLDIHMPGQDGKSLLKTLLAFDVSAYVIMATADGSKENVVEAAKGGAKGFIVKPFSRARVMMEYSKAVPHKIPAGPIIDDLPPIAAAEDMPSDHVTA